MRNLFIQMRRWCLILCAVASAAPGTRAEVLFGNINDGSYGYGIYSSYPYPYITGAAVSFTPTMNFSISSVTLSLADYTQPFGLELLEGTDPNNALVVGNFSNPSPNDGSPADFTFDTVYDWAGGWSPCPVNLCAGETYWLFAYGNVTSSGTIEWMGGTTPEGEANYNGTAIYSGDPEGGFLVGLYQNSPAFTVNSVPEPSFTAVIMLGAMLLLFRRVPALQCRQRQI